MKKLLFFAALPLFASSVVPAQEEPAPTPETIAEGSALYSRHCAACHGPRMANPEGAFDLRKFPSDQHDRFVNSVSNGKNSMPPWRGLLGADEIEALWAYVVAGENK